jgi:lysozyme family protein
MGWLSNLLKKKKQVYTNQHRPSHLELIKDLKIDPDKIDDVDFLVKQYIDIKERYALVKSFTNVPSDVLFAIHYRESSLNFKGVLHNGEFILGTGRKTKLVPKGRGPFSTWEEAAIDAMEIEKNKFPKVWDMEGKLSFCEAYNGLGYFHMDVSSPYVYAFTNAYKSGKYIRDGVYSSAAIDKQCGCAAIILAISIQETI